MKLIFMISSGLLLLCGVYVNILWTNFSIKPLTNQSKLLHIKHKLNECTSDSLQGNDWIALDVTRYQESRVRFSSSLDNVRSIKRNRKYASRSRSGANVRFETVSSTNRTLRPVRLFHLPQENQQQQQRLSPYILELYVIVDQEFVRDFKGDMGDIVGRVNTLFKIVNSLFFQFNVKVVVVGLEIWQTNRVSLDVEDHHILKTLANFKRTHDDVHHDCLHALVGEHVVYSTLRGKSNHGKMCVYSDCVAYTRDSPSLKAEETARTIAHELGHNFGLNHDTEECECQGCIMATEVEFGTTSMDWSPCSIRDMPGLLEHGMGACLHDEPIESETGLLPSDLSALPETGPSVVRVFNRDPEKGGLIPTLISSFIPPNVRQSLCGNGKLDFGEECDCGTSESCPIAIKSCCDVNTCRFINGATCAGGPCCEVSPLPGGGGSKCSLKSRSSVCRPVDDNSCDLPEYCDGESEWCPADVFITDGESCYTPKGYRSHCIRGGCRATNEWCQILWGETGAVASYAAAIFNLPPGNARGVDDVANCGKLRPAAEERWQEVHLWPNKPCKNWLDAECGRLWCVHQNEKAMLLGWVQSTKRIHLSSGRTCEALVYDPVSPDPFSKASAFSRASFGTYAATMQDAGMTPDGTPCQLGMCYNGTCVREDQLPFRKTCDCAFNGVCNNRGHCHCIPGFAPPDCREAGNGGSIDSGPPPPDMYKYALIVAICFIIFILCPAFCIMMFCLLCRCKKGKLILPKSGPLVVPGCYQSSNSEPFNWTAFEKSFSECCRRCKPRINNDPPVICAFGKPEMKNGLLITNGHGEGYSLPKQNGHVIATALKTENGKPNTSTQVTIDTFRMELSEIGAKPKPGYLLDLEKAWEEAEMIVTPPKHHPTPTTNQITPMSLRPEISAPQLDTTTFKGETRSLAVAAKIQQSAPIVHYGTKKRPTGKRHVTQPLTSFNDNIPTSPKHLNNGVSRSVSHRTEPVVNQFPGISSPTLQTTTYAHDLLDLSEAYSTIRRPKKLRAVERTPSYATVGKQQAQNKTQNKMNSKKTFA